MEDTFYHFAPGLSDSFKFALLHKIIQYLPVLGLDNLGVSVSSHCKGALNVCVHRKTANAL